MVRSFVSVTAALLCLTASSQWMQSVEAYTKYVALLPNGDNIPDSPAIGHPDAEGLEGTNAFGDAFAAAGNAWTVALCEADTDGDGYTNGQELGDPCCTWTTTNTGDLITDGVSHPSDASKTPSNDKLTAGCSTSSTTTTTTTSGSGSGAGTVKAGDVGDIDISPVSTTLTPSTPADDDEDDSDESAVLTSAATTMKTLTGAIALVAAGVAAIVNM